MSHSCLTRCKHPVSKRCRALALAFLLTLTFGLSKHVSAQDPLPPTATFDLTALQSEVDEGDVVYFMIEDKEYYDAATGDAMRFDADLSPVEWDFGDGRQPPASDYGLNEIKHWFHDDGDGPYQVKATYQGTTEEVGIQVNDVLPVIHSIAITENPEVGEPVVFQAAVRDPGFDDDISFTWDLGDGAMAEGANAIHTYDEEGTYAITLSVADEARSDPPRTFSFQIGVGEYYGDISENTLSISGDFAASEAEIESLTIIGNTGNMRDAGAAGMCQVRVEMRSDEHDMSVVLTARLDPGLAPGDYRIGETDEFDGTHNQDIANPGTFFAEFKPPEDQADRIEGGLRVGGPFWSDNGRVTISRFEAGMLELRFEAAFTENLPDRFDARQVYVRGALSTSLETSAPIDDTGVAGGADAVRGIGILMEALSDLAAGNEPETPAGLNIKSYACGGDEPGTFDLVEADPPVNSKHHPYENSTVNLTFSQSLDPDSVVNAETLEDNLSLAVRVNGGGFETVKGSWMPSMQNPRVISFIPQARLVPGTIHCVIVNGGEDGLRSFTGNILGTSALAAPSDEMQNACEPLNENQFTHTFATRVEMESIGVDLYQRSLLGSHTKYVDGDYSYAIVRVRPWWQSAFSRFDSSSQVQEFDARVFARAGEQLLPSVDATAGGAASTQSNTESVVRQIKRPDRYSAAERARAEHSSQFGFFSESGAGSVRVFAMIQHVNDNGESVGELDSSLLQIVDKVGPFEPLNIGTAWLRDNCAEGLEEGQCGWEDRGNSVYGYYDEYVFSAMVPPVTVNRILHEVTLNFTESCPGGLINEVCFSGALSEDDINARLANLAVAVLNNPLDSGGSPSALDMLLVEVPPSFMVDWASRPTELFEYSDSSTNPPTIFFSAGESYLSDYYIQREVAKRMAQVIIQDSACGFDGASSCDLVPIQGMELEDGDVDADTIVIVNAHHAEVQQPWVPVMQSSEYRGDRFFFSAYNYARLFEALQRRN